jgi:hypothetical protein
MPRPLSSPSVDSRNRFAGRSLLLCLVTCYLFALPAHAQTYSFSLLSTSASLPSTDGTSVVFEKSDGIDVIPFAGGTTTNLVPTTTPGGVGAVGPPILRSSIVYYAGSDGYYSVPLTGGTPTRITPTTTGTGQTITPAALPVALAPNDTGIPGIPLPVPSVGSDLFIPSAGGAVFTANLTSSGGASDLVVLQLSPEGTLSTVIDSNALSGCSRITNFATDGTIYAAWALSSSNHVLLLENNSPSLTCSNVLLDLGDYGDTAMGQQGTYRTGTLPGQPVSGAIMAQFFAPSTVIDAGYIYFTATLTLSSTTSNHGYYSGIFRIQPGGTLQKVVATTDAVGAGVSPDSSITPFLFCSSFGVQGNYLAFGGCGLSQYGFANPSFPNAGPYNTQFFFYNQSTSAISQVATANSQLSTNEFVYSYNTASPGQAGLSASGKLAFLSDSFDVVNHVAVTQGNYLYSVDLAHLSAATTTTLVASPYPGLYGTATSLTATVATAGTSAPTGTVAFSDDGSIFATTTLGSGGIATASAPLLTGGTHSLSATYGGDGSNAISTGTETLLVNTATPTVTLTASPSSSSTYGSSLGFLATTTGVTGAANPTGNYNVDDGTVMLIQGVGGSFSISSLRVGSHSITATYVGDANYAAASSPAVSVTVSAASTATALTASPTAAVFGDAVVLSAGVTAGGGTPSSTVNFTANGSAIGSATLDGTGHATLTTTSLPVGTDSIQAVFAGSMYYPTSTSSTVSVTITAPSFGISTTTPSLTIPQGQSGTDTISITPSGNFTSPIVFGCTGLPAYATCSFSPNNVAPGLSVVTTTLTVATDVKVSAVLSRATVWYAGLLLLGFGLLGGRRRMRRTMPRLLALVLLMVGMGALGACGSGVVAAAITPTGTSTVTATATSGSIVQTLPLSITIAP